jgi:hypothetical protein
LGAIGADGAADYGVHQVELALELAALNEPGLRMSLRPGRRDIFTTSGEYQAELDDLP